MRKQIVKFRNVFFFGFRKQNDISSTETLPRAQKGNIQGNQVFATIFPQQYCLVLQGPNSASLTGVKQRLYWQRDPSVTVPLIVTDRKVRSDTLGFIHRNDK